MKSCEGRGGVGDTCALRRAHLCLCLFSTARETASFPVRNVMHGRVPHTVRSRVLSPIKWKVTTLDKQQNLAL
jgi:hypothetical protein